MSNPNEILQKKIKRTKWDKVISTILFFVGFIWFFVDKSATIIQDEEIRFVIQAVSVFSAFYTVLSFVLDGKIDKLREKLSGTIAGYTDQLQDNHDELNNNIQSSLLERGLIESRVLSDYETNVRGFLEFQAGSNSRALIIVITNSAEVEQEQFAEAIKKNILDNHQYIYITPFNDEKFTPDLKAKIFEGEENNHLLVAAFLKNIRHFQDEEFFKFLPEYSDIVVYVRMEQNERSKKAPLMRGFYCFQNDALTTKVANGHSAEFYFYTEMTSNIASKIAEYAQKLAEWDSSTTWTSDLVEAKESPLGGQGLFAKKKIKKGEVLLRKGGWFIAKSDLDPALLSGNNYVQIDDHNVLAAKRAHEDKTYGIAIRINHSCENANCGMRNEIEMVAIKDISEGTEVLIDYAYWDLEYTRFACKCDCSATCQRKQGTKVDISTLRGKSDRIAPYLRDKLIQPTQKNRAPRHPKGN